MNRLEKTASIEEIQKKFSTATAAFLTEYRGMTVQGMHELRNKVRDGKGEVKVAKNRLVKIALQNTPFANLADGLKGPIALAIAYSDPVPVAKALVDSLSETSPFQLKMGSLNSKSINDVQIKDLSKLPDRNTLLSMLVGTLASPIQNFLGVISAVPRDFVGVMNAVKTEKEKQ